MSLKYMVAYDGSANAMDAINTAIHMMDAKNDELFIMTCAEKLHFDIGPIKTYNTQSARVQKAILLPIRDLCAEKKLKSHFVFGSGAAPGELLCRAVEMKGVDFLFVGRRGMNKAKRIVAGSTSRYVMEHADCNVVIVKGCYLPEEHVRLNEVRKIEEEERRRRMHADEDSKVIAQEKAQRDAAHIAAVIEEEEEKRARIAEAQLDPEHAKHVPIEELHLEDEEELVKPASTSS
jgi:nucleotide-binding universal stress UspA family protein